MKNLLKITLLLSIMVLSHFTFSQSQPVTINVAVLPPYTPHISDYMENPNKVIITMYLQSSSVDEMDIYLHGSITGESGINIYTDPNYKPGMPINLQNGIPYTLNADDMSNLYGMNNVIFEGITQEQVMNQGALPEDYYQICLQAFNFNTDLAVSDMHLGCSPPFLITNMEPPIITSPVCGDEIHKQAQVPQSVYINWTLPMGANPSSISYFFRMVEVPENSGIDPIDALNDNTFASVYEEEIFSNSLLLTSDKVQLLPGFVYAFFVQAIAMDQIYYFNNNGVSESCTFTYIDDSEIMIDDSIGTLFEFSDFIEQYELLPNTKISGRLLYKVPEGGATTMSLENFNPGSQEQTIPNTQGINYDLVSQGAIGFTGSANENHIGFINPENNMGITDMHLSPPLGRGLLHANTESTAGTNPLANTEVRLVVRLGVFDHGPSFPSFVVQPEGKISGRGETTGGIVAPILVDIDGNVVPNGSFLNIILDTDETDENGNFSFDFFDDFFTAPCQVNDITGHTDIVDAGIDVQDIIGNTINPMINPIDLLFQGLMDPSLNIPNPNNQTQVMSGVYYSAESTYGYICLKVEVVNQKFCSPDVDIFAMPGDQIDLGNQVAKIKTYHAAITVKSNDQIPQYNQANNGLAGADIKILRDVQDLDNEHPIILMEEGEKLETRTLNNNGEYKNVSLVNASEDGTILINNLVKHWSPTDQASPYWIEISTRKEDADLAYENTIYNYKSRSEFLQTKPGNQADYNVALTPVICNNAYQPPTVHFEFELEPNKPEIKGTVMAQSNMENIGVENARVILFTQQEYEGISHYKLTGGSLGGGQLIDWDWETLEGLSVIDFTIEEETRTNEAGIFRFDSLTVNYDGNESINGPYRRLMIIKEGYKTQIIKPFDSLPYNLNNGQLKDLKDINLVAKDHLLGTVVDEEGIPVKAYVRLLDNGPYSVTERRDAPYIFGPNPQDFQVAVEPTGNRIEIQPISRRYFTREVEVNSIPNERQSFTVYKKLHRLHLIVLNESQEEIPYARVVVGDSLVYGTANAYGEFRANFASADAQFVLKIQADNYAPHQEILDLPISPHTNTRFASLQHAFNIYGFIIDTKTKEKIPQAKVFAELQNTDGHHLYIETFTNEEGYYNLEGIPLDTRKLELHIVKDGNNPSYIGRIAEIAVHPNNHEYYDFELYHLDGWDLTEILGFPMQVEGFLGQTNPNRAIIQGYLYDIPSTVGYQVLEADIKIPFTSLLVEKQEDGKIIPVGNSITLNEIVIPLKVNHTFSGALMEPIPCRLTDLRKKLKVEKLNNKKGQIKAAVKLDLESFRFDYTFGGNFYVGDQLSSYTSTVFMSNMGNTMQSTRRYVFDINCNKQPTPLRGYSLLGFTADADMEHSIIEGDVISLKTILNTNIPLKNDTLNLRLPIGTIEIKQNDINLIKAPGDELEFKLEEWDVVAKEEWDFDINESSIILPEVLINSKKGFSATVKNLRILPDALREGEVDLNGGINLGGIVPLELAQGLEPVFNYHAGIGHYRISLVGTTDGEAAAFVRDLPNTDSDLEFKSVGLLSNDEEALTLNKNMQFFDIININVDGIMTGDGFFKLVGNPVQGFIPEFIPMGGAIIAYTKPNIFLEARLERLQGKVECFDNVTFKLDNMNEDIEGLPDIQQIKTGEYSIYGDIKVAPSAHEGGVPFILRGLLTRTNDSIKIDVIHVDDPINPIRIGESVQYLKLDQQRMDVFKGKITVVNNTWDSLRFSAHPNPEDMVGFKENNVINFAVNGNISANTDEVSISQIDTPFGQANFAFNFEERSLTGSVAINVPITVGYATLKNGQVHMRFDPQGFYVLVDANIFISAVPLRGGLVIGFTGRNLSAELAPLLSGFITDKPSFSSGLKGFYVIGQRSVDLGEFDVADAITISLNMGAGSYIYCNFADGFNMSVGGYGYLVGTGGLTTPCDIGVFIHGQAITVGGKSNNNWWYYSGAKAAGGVSYCVGEQHVSVYGIISNVDEACNLNSIEKWDYGDCPPPPCMD